MLISQAWFEACLGRGTLTNTQTGEVTRLYKIDADSIELLPNIIPNPNTPQPQMDDSWQMHSSCCGLPRNRGQCSCWPTLTSVTLAK
jgi:hypothetical protein